MTEQFVQEAIVEGRRKRKEAKRLRKEVAIAAIAARRPDVLSTDNLPVAASRVEEKTQEIIPLPVVDAASTSTCQKRVVACSLYDAQGELIACESNRCEPVGGTCCRLGSQSQREGYVNDDDCRSEHAEIRALNALEAGALPVRAILYGHKWPCPACDAALRAAGVRDIEVVPEGEGIGLRQLAQPPVRVHRPRPHNYEGQYGPHEWDSSYD